MAQCMSPFHLKEPKKGMITVPCGKCYDCRMRRANEWSFRLRQEGRRSSTSFFVTLTYDTEFVPITDKGYMSLLQKDVQDFFKRLRYYHNIRFKNHKSEDRPKIRYFVVGEYGSKTMRPHYHLIIFNAELDDLYLAWKKGGIHVGTVTGASIGYTLKYMLKEKQIPRHNNDDRLPEFQNMSKGLGYNYLTDKIRKWHEDDLYNRMYIPIEGGKKIAMPRYFREKIYSEEEREEIILRIIANAIGDVRDDNVEREDAIRLGKARKLGRKRNDENLE